jgi:regulation of enolase protein 1 (concanavalin A-like superfamily)
MDSLMSTPNRPEDQQPPALDGGTGQPDATVAYIPKNTTSPVGAVHGELHAHLRAYDFLDPARAPGELGWLAHYRVLRCIGEGGMGLVFEAEDTDLLRRVALKVIRPELAGAPQAAQRFMLEARAMAALKHNHIVTIYQVGLERGVPFLAMEYLQGMSLHCWLKKGRKASLDLMLRLGREVAAGLAAAHKRGLVHRDIKPANIWLEAPIGRVKILDFGLARSASQDVHITNPGTALGTPAYMSPEQASGEEVDASGDLFSLGCVLYQLCTGALPFPGTTVMAVLSSLSSNAPSPVRDLNPAVPPTLDALVMRLLAKNPSDRPPTAEAVVEAIKSIERELLAERQKAELSSATQPPAAAGSRKPAQSGIAGELGAPRDAAKARRGRRALAIAATVALLAIAVTAIRGVVLSRRATTIAAVRSAPNAVAAIEPPPVVPEPGPPVSPPDPIAHPTAMAPPAKTGGTVSEAHLAATPEHVLKGREIPEKPRMREPAKPAKETSRPTDVSDVIDPDGDCDVVLNREVNRATILVPGTAHLLSAELGRMNAPRILGDIQGDFAIRLQVMGTSHPGGKATTSQYAPYHGAGILLWQDPENYVRLEIAADLRKGKVFPYANFELRQAGSLAVSRGLKIEDGSSHLRLERHGNEIRGAFSPDGDHWTLFSPMIVDFKDRLKVGVVAVNSASKPLKAGFEELQITRKPATEAEVDADRPSTPKRPPSQEIAPAPPGTSSRPDDRSVESSLRASRFR